MASICGSNFGHIPSLSEGNGFISNMSMPCIFPKISKRSRPVACSRSVGMVPGAAPGGRRSDSDLISAFRNLVSHACIRRPPRQHLGGSKPDKLGQDRTDLQMEVVCPVTRPASGPISLFHLVRRLQESLGQHFMRWLVVVGDRSSIRESFARRRTAWCDSHKRSRCKRFGPHRQAPRQGEDTACCRHCVGARW